MQCVFFDKDDGTCQAKIDTSNWKPETYDRNNLCKTDNFEKCPRLKVFLINKSASKTSLNVETSKS